MRSPTTVKKVQQLAGRMASLSQFLAKVADKSLPLFQCLRKNDRFAWTNECERAFGELRKTLTSPPILTKPRTDSPLLVYLWTLDSVVSAVLVQEKCSFQTPVYFVSRVLQGAEVHYQKIEKLAFTILITTRKLRHYFQSYEIIIRTDYPIRQVLQKPDLAGRMMKWSIELIILEGPGGILLEQSLRFEFHASNNQSEYEALLAGMALAKEMGATSLSARSDSQLVTGQVTGTFQAKDPQLARYLEKGNVLFIQEELDSWMGPYIAYPTRGELPEDKREASLVQRQSARFVVINERLYRRGFSSPLLRCLTISQAQRLMDEVHSGCRPLKLSGSGQAVTI
uniref:Retrovirus-related Pol polyprotein from transposon 17.6 n=1 Tax=Cajanus cajan TaxID=3821 RepID=A0A151UIK1_CAJCA